MNAVYSYIDLHIIYIIQHKCLTICNKRTVYQRSPCEVNERYIDLHNYYIHNTLRGARSKASCKVYGRGLWFMGGEGACERRGGVGRVRGFLARLNIPSEEVLTSNFTWVLGTLIGVQYEVNER